mmetsp:Transcript_158566/g.504594  ORF Transcript_158566/g.504594 Transcript_158566/m.504594 type:complete len:98 (-) Transcript_158566:568-861(-)
MEGPRSAAMPLFSARLREILASAVLPDLPSGVGASDEELVAWFEGHLTKVRQHFEGREGSSLLEFALEEGDEAIQRKLEDFLGVPMDWGCYNVTTWA